MITDDRDLMNYDFSTGFDTHNTEDTWITDRDWCAPRSIDYIGEPTGSYAQQTTGFTCAVVSQQMILNDFGVISPETGQPLSEAELTYVATANSWLHNGTSPADVGNLLEYYGVAVHHGFGIEGLVEELQKGHKVIVGVDSNELWNADNPMYNQLKDYLEGEAANHAIVVKGIISDGGKEPHVVVNDPGVPDGEGNEYPLSVFLDAFRDGDCHYVATNHPPIALADHEDFGKNFDLASGTYTTADRWLTSTDSPDMVADTVPALSASLARSLENLDAAQRRSLLQVI